jgi:phospholipase/carboxylesterase
LLTHLEATRGIACENLTLMGFSQGCLMTMEVGLTHERPFAGLVGISGWVANIEAYPRAFGAAADRQRILMTHGTADQVIPIAVTRPQAHRLQGLGLDLTWREYAKAHGLDTESELGEIRDFILGANPAP